MQNQISVHNWELYLHNKENLNATENWLHEKVCGNTLKHYKTKSVLDTEKQGKTVFCEKIGN